MALEWLKPILGDGYTEEIDKAISAEIGKGFVARTDFNELKETKKNVDAQLAEANKTIEGLQATDKDLETVRKEAAEYKARAEQAEKDAAAQLDAYKFDTWFDGLAAQYHARNGAVIRTLAGEDRMKALRESKNRDEDGKALFEDLTKNSAYAFEDQTPPPPPYAGGTGGSPVTASDAAMRAATVVIRVYTQQALTVDTGDIITPGLVTAQVNSSADILRQFPDSVKVMRVRDNRRGSPQMRHWRIEGE